MLPLAIKAADAINQNFMDLRIYFSSFLVKHFLIPKAIFLVNHAIARVVYLQA
jgi:hypothetical protein